MLEQYTIGTSCLTLSFVFPFHLVCFLPPFLGRPPFCFDVRDESVEARDESAEARDESEEERDESVEGPDVPADARGESVEVCNESVGHDDSVDARVGSKEASDEPVEESENACVKWVGSAETFNELAETDNGSVGERDELVEAPDELIESRVTSVLSLPCVCVFCPFLGRVPFFGALDESVEAQRESLSEVRC